MVEGQMDIKALSIDELAEVVNLFPWFGAARKELCLRMSELGGSGWGDREYATNALYLGSRRIIAEIVHKGEARDCSDKDLETLLKAYTVGEQQADETLLEDPQETKRVVVVGGDFFSQADYNSVRKSDDNVFSAFAAKARSEEQKTQADQPAWADFCTETLARIYMDQGYYEQAKFIYSQLILRYPEKSAYFAALIQKLEQLAEIKN